MISPRVVNLCSGKPDLPVQRFLPLGQVKTSFTGKKSLVNKGLYASIFGKLILFLLACDGFNILILEIKAIILRNYLRAIFGLQLDDINVFSGQFIGRPQTFVELQLHFKLHFYTEKMQFET